MTDAMEFTITQDEMPTEEVAETGTEETAECDTVAAFENMADRLDHLEQTQRRVIEALNIVGGQQQTMSDGLANFFNLMGSLGSDFSNLSLVDKMKILKEMLNG